MSVHTLFLIAIGGGVLMVAALTALVITLIVEDRRADREDREQHGHARPRESWRTRFQAWVVDRYGARTGVSLWRRFLAWVYAPVNVPALVALPPDASAGTPNLLSVAAPVATALACRPADGHAGEPYVTAPTSPCGTVTSPAGARAESVASTRIPGPGGAPSTVHHFAALAWQYAGENARSGCWPMGAADADTGYSREHRDQLRGLLIDDHAAAIVQIRRRFADLEIRDQARFARITAGIKAGAA